MRKDWFEDDNEIRLLHRGKRRLLDIVFGRTMVITLLLVLQIAIMVLGAHYLGRYYPALTIVLRVMSVAVIIYLVNKSGSATTKITWIILVMALPAFGVYACYLETSGGIFPAVVNVGRHPTLPEGHVTVEAHVLDEFLSLYGRNVRLTFLKFMRPEQKFDSIETLRAQIAHDADDCRAYFAQLQ